MKSFLKSTVIFLLILLGMWLLAEWRLKQVTYAFGKKEQYLTNHLSEINTLILGSSQNEHLLDPVYLTSVKAVSLAHGGQDLIIDSLFLSRYLSSLSSLKTLIIECTYHTLESERYNPHPLDPFYLRHYGLNVSSNEPCILDYSMLKDEPHEKLELLSPFFTPNPTSEYGIMNGPEDGLDETHRFKSMNYDVKKIDSSTNNLFINRHKTRNIGAIKRNENIIYWMLNLAETKGIRVLIVRPPLYHTYLEARIPEKLNVVESLLGMIKKDYPQTLIIDYNDNFSWKVTDFINEDHVSYLGAKKASLYLDSLLRVNIN